MKKLEKALTHERNLENSSGKEVNQNNSIVLLRPAGPHVSTVNRNHKEKKKSAKQTCEIVIVTGNHGSEINKKPRGMKKLFKEVFTKAKVYGKFEIWIGGSLPGGPEHKGKIEVSGVEPGKILTKAQPKDNSKRRTMIVHVENGQEEFVKNAILEAQGMKSKEENIQEEQNASIKTEEIKVKTPEGIEYYLQREAKELFVCSIFQYESESGYFITDEKIASLLIKEYELPYTEFQVVEFIIDPLIEEGLLVETNFLDEVTLGEIEGRLLEMSEEARNTCYNQVVKQKVIDNLSPGVKAISVLEKLVKYESSLLSELNEIDSRVVEFEQQIVQLKDKKHIISQSMMNPKFKQAKSKLNEIYRLLDLQN